MTTINKFVAYKKCLSDTFVMYNSDKINFGKLRTDSNNCGKMYLGIESKPDDIIYDSTFYDLALVGSRLFSDPDAQRYVTKQSELKVELKNWSKACFEACDSGDPCQHCYV